MARVEKITDTQGRFVCLADTMDGTLIIKDKKNRIIAELPPGGRVSVFRDEIITTIIRTEGGKFRVLGNR